MVAWNKGMKMSPEHCKKLSIAHLGQIPWCKGKGNGKKQSPEVIEKRRLKLIGHKVSPEARKRIGDAQRGTKHSPELEKQRLSHLGQVAWNKGLKYSKERCEQMSEYGKAHLHPRFGKHIVYNRPLGTPYSIPYWELEHVWVKKESMPDKPIVFVEDMKCEKEKNEEAEKLL